MGYNGKTWERLGTIEMYVRQLMRKFGINWKNLGSHISHGNFHYSVGTWDPTHFPMLPNASHHFPIASQKLVGFNDICWEPMGDNLGNNGNANGHRWELLG